jgi:hypothetical protein
MGARGSVDGGYEGGGGERKDSQNFRNFLRNEIVSQVQ